MEKMDRIELDDLHYMRFRNWLKKANKCKNEDPISAFIFSWISFNHYYSTFAMKNKPNNSGDKNEIINLVKSDEFGIFFNQYKKHISQLNELKIELPIRNFRYPDKNVPPIEPCRCNLYDLTNDQIFDVIYQIRNNLFHGRKDTDRDKRDRTLCIIASEFMIPFLATLLNNTSGENHKYDDDKNLIEYIQKLAKF